MRTLRRLVCLLPAVWLLAGPASAGTPVDYARDIQPLLEYHCYECHGPEKQKNGYRLDQRARAFSGLVRHNIIPGSSRTSRVYTRVLNSQTGLRMPPNGELSTNEIELIRRWIDEGAAWPDALANDAPVQPLDPEAVAFVERLRVAERSDEHALRAGFTRNPALLNRRGPGGATPLMFIALYGNARLLGAALDAGGDPTLRNDANVTALHWAVDDAAKVRLLLDHGAAVDAESGIGRAPLALAADRADSAEVIALLLKRGAKPTPQALNLAARMNPAGVRLLLAAGAKPHSDAADAALRFGCADCLAQLTASGLRVPKALLDVVPIGSEGDPHDVRAALAHQPDVNLADPKGRTPLLLAAISERITPELLQNFVDLGASLETRGPDGRNALDHALRVGRAPIIDFFRRAGLTPTQTNELAPARVIVNSPRAAVERALPLLQTSSARFYAGGGCLSCHHNTMTSETVARARQRAIPVDEALARDARGILAADLAGMREQTLQGVFAPGGQATTTGYLLMAYDADGQRPSLATDALVRLLRNSQAPDGRWFATVRPPIEGSAFTATAVSLRGVLLYGDRASPVNRVTVKKARRWLERNAPSNTEDRVFRLFGLVWAGAEDGPRGAAVDELLGEQRADGGWAQLPWGASDAYATGQALVALQAAGVATDSPAWRRGAQYLLDSQLADGSWLVKSRSHATQSYFESGFPHGENQFISAAATNWAAQALMLAIPTPGDQPRATASMLLPSGSSTNAP